MKEERSSLEKVACLEVVMVGQREEEVHQQQQEQVHSPSKQPNQQPQQRRLSQQQQHNDQVSEQKFRTSWGKPPHPFDKGTGKGAQCSR